MERKRAENIAEARTSLASRSIQDRERFERTLRRGEKAYPIREDNQFYTVSAPMALMRYAVLEIGRRFADRRQIDHRDDVFFFELEEARTVLQSGNDQHSLVKRRKAERAWWRLIPARIPMARIRVRRHLLPHFRPKSDT
ncbi:MAG: hypothetical protein M1548_10715 [Actinobacteria bacterium]|nr:hypothetical protein [Actinomycetota bacterium]